MSQISKVSRIAVEREIWNKPPLYLKVWMYLVQRAGQWRQWGLEQGQLYASIGEVQDACSWKIGYRTQRPSKDEVYQVLIWIREVMNK